ncbi:MAG: HAMP domain-containing histidine kinase [Planctomycetaceae bacterium]|nr:HAMP domain-containing histidine kinase [Planctomycetaceae bacterium]
MPGHKPQPTDRDFMHGDQEDWDLDIIQALISPGTVEEAALACAAAWLNFLAADRVAVAVFVSSSRCIVAHGQRDDSGEVTIDVGLENGQIAALLRPEDLFDEVGGPCRIDAPTDVISWPEYLSAVVARCEELGNYGNPVGDHREDRLELVKKLSRQLLSRWSPLAGPSANADHMESMAEFAAGAGHEINNPLGSIIGQSQLLLKRSDSAEQKQALETIGAQAWRIRDMIGDTMLFARPPEPEFSDHDLNAIVESTFPKTFDRFEGQIRSRLRLPDDVVAVLADDTQIAALISHLIANACQAVQDLESSDGEVTVTVSRLSEYAAAVTVDDNGYRIDEVVRRHLFDPFYSGRQAGRGLGFGLCHAWQIARMHNGMLLHEALEDGNRFRVILPVEADDTGS